HLAAEVDQVVGGDAEGCFEARLLLVGELQLLDDLRPAPPLAGREVGGEDRRAEQQSAEDEGQASFHRELSSWTGFVSVHDSHCTTPWNSRRSSDCQASWRSRSSLAGIVAAGGAGRGFFNRFTATVSVGATAGRACARPAYTTA